MTLQPAQIFEEYREGTAFKESLGVRGLSDQIRLNERFYCGDQWHGAKCGSDRPLVRHNVIKRIGDYKMSQILSSPFTVTFSADGVPGAAFRPAELRRKRQEIAPDPHLCFAGRAGEEEINLVTSALSNYHRATAERIGFTALCERALRNAYISGSTVFYTYWDNQISTGLYADDEHTAPVAGDISCEVLDIENIVFADPYLEDLQRQPYIIIASYRPAGEVLREAEKNGVRGLRGVSRRRSGDKVLVLTRLFKEYKENGEVTVRCIKTTEREIIRPAFDTGLRLYPLALFSWERRGRLIYGDSEVTYLIPNQIAINRMITANVWASMTSGMPIMVVNGDTVTEEITNDPGQILRVYGSNEDVSGAVRYITPPDCSAALGSNIGELIENTLTQSGANEVARGDSRADNATALMTLRSAATLPLQLIQNRFYSFIEEISRIWADFWLTQYGTRALKMQDETGVWYLPFCAERYRNLQLTARVDVGTEPTYSVAERMSVLNGLYEKGILTKRQLLERLPAGILPDLQELIAQTPQEFGKDGENT